MANLTYKKNTTKSFTVKGQLSTDAKIVSYDDKDGGHFDIELNQYLNEFAGEQIQISIKAVSEDDLYLPDDEIDISEVSSDEE